MNTTHIIGSILGVDGEDMAKLRRALWSHTLELVVRISRSDNSITNARLDGDRHITAFLTTKGL